MDFKATLAQEAEQVFLNVGEFGVSMLIDGKPCIGLWGEESKSAPDVYDNTVSAWGLNAESAVLYIPEGFMALPMPNQDLKINDLLWTVKNAQPQQGLVRLELIRNVA